MPAPADPPSFTDPYAHFAAWFADAEKSEPNDPNAVIVATATPEGRPSSRAVLLKEWDHHGFVFYTNQHSRKGGEIAANPHVALLFYWKSLHRQIRIEGPVEHVSAAESDAYYNTRARISRLGAWASLQSSTLPARAELERRLAEAEAKYPGEAIPRPPHWGGLRVLPSYFEFWQDMPFRLHDRTTYEADGTSWRKAKLFP